MAVKSTIAHRARSYPLPEEILPGRWEISPTDRPRVDIGARHLFINLKNDPQWATVRAHELGHIRWSPTSPVAKGVSPFALQVCEDMRINYLLRHADIDMSAGAPPHILEGAALSTKESERESCGLLVADLLGPDDPQVLPFLMKHHGPDVIYRLRSHMGEAYRLFSGRSFPGSHHASKPWSFKRCAQVARWFDSLWDEEGKDKDAKEGDDDQAIRGDDVPALERGWGKLTLERPPLTVSAERWGKRPRAIDAGDIPIQPWRVTTDMRIFRFRKPSRKGTILIDGSGSMHLDADTIADMARRAPAATIAAYGGNYDDGPLRILAVNGKIADPKGEAYTLPGGNVVDGPALQWLSLQDRPRIWVCDGNVTGIGDCSSMRLEENALDIMTAGGIVRVDACDDAVDLFDSKRARKVQTYRSL